MGNETGSHRVAGSCAGVEVSPLEFWAALEELVRSVSTPFISLQNQETTGAIAHALKKIWEFVRCERVFWGCFLVPENKFCCIDEWCAPGVNPRFSKRTSGQSESLPLMPPILATAERSAAAADHDELLRRTGLLQDGGTSLVTPIWYGESSLGFLGLDGLQAGEIVSDQVKLSIKKEMFAT
jgi:hypothetical protein